MNRNFLIVLSLLGLEFSSFAMAVPPALPVVAASEAGFDETQLAEIGAVIDQAIAEHKLPGCVVAIGRHEQICWLKAFGNRQVEPSLEPMTTDTIFDLASLTKPIATATSVMILIEKGMLRLDDPIVKHWPEFAAEGKQVITVEHLLTHVGGLIADNRIDDYQLGVDESWRRIAALKPLATPRERFIYSDVGFLVLGQLVERVSGQKLNDFAKSNLFEPLGMSETGYRPAPELRVRIVPTDKRNGEFIRGDVHDPRAHLLGGVAGHAGLFSTATDLAKFAAAMSQRGRIGETRILGESTWSEMTRAREVPKGQRCLGWDMRTGYSSNRGTTMSDRAFGHGGFTGTAMWIDPDSGLWVIFLSNRVHPNGKGSVNPLAGRIGTIAAQALKH